MDSKNLKFVKILFISYREFTESIKIFYQNIARGQALKFIFSLVGYKLRELVPKKDKGIYNYKLGRKCFKKSVYFSFFLRIIENEI